MIKVQAAFGERSKAACSFYYIDKVIPYWLRHRCAEAVDNAFSTLFRIDKVPSAYFLCGGRKSAGCF